MDEDTIMDERTYTLKVSHEGENLATRSGNNLNRLTACLFSMLEYDFNNAVGEIVENKSGEVVRRCRKSVGT